MHGCLSMFIMKDIAFQGSGIEAKIEPIKFLVMLSMRPPKDSRNQCQFENVSPRSRSFSNSV